MIFIILSILFISINATKFHSSINNEENNIIMDWYFDNMLEIINTKHNESELHNNLNLIYLITEYPKQTLNCKSTTNYSNHIHDNYFIWNTHLIKNQIKTYSWQGTILNYIELIHHTKSINSRNYFEDIYFNNQYLSQPLNLSLDTFIKCSPNTYIEDKLQSIVNNGIFTNKFCTNPKPLYFKDCYNAHLYDIITIKNELLIRPLITFIDMDRISDRLYKYDSMKYINYKPIKPFPVIIIGFMDDKWIVYNYISDWGNDGIGFIDMSIADDRYVYWLE